MRADFILDMEKLAQQPSRYPTPAMTTNKAERACPDPAMGIQTPGARREMHPLALLISHHG